MLPELYHAHHSLHMEDLPFWLELAAQFGDPILELGCGTGRLLLPLAQAGYRMVGLDHDLEMLKFLRAHGEQTAQPRVLVSQADISHFRLAMQFPLIILPCNTFSTLKADQRRSGLRCIRQHLRRGGAFAVSLPNPDLLDHLPASPEAEYEEAFIHPHTGNPVQVSSAWNKTWHTFDLLWIYDQLFPDGTLNRTTVEISHQRIATHVYLDEIQGAGLELSSVFGDYDRSPYGPASPYLILLATG